MGHNSDVMCIEFLGDGRRFVSGSCDTTLKLWRYTEDAAAEHRRVQSAPIGTMHGHTDDVNAVAVSDDGVLLVSGSNDGSIRLWSSQSLSCVAVFADPSPSDTPQQLAVVNAVAFCPHRPVQRLSELVNTALKCLQKKAHGTMDTAAARETKRRIASFLTGL